MTKYVVYMTATASCSIEVEADNPDEAIDLAYEADKPYAPAFCGFDLGDWELPSDMNPEYNRPEDDWDVIE